MPNGDGLFQAYLGKERAEADYFAAQSGIPFSAYLRAWLQLRRTVQEDESVLHFFGRVDARAREIMRGGKR